MQFYLPLLNFLDFVQKALHICNCHSFCVICIVHSLSVTNIYAHIAKVLQKSSIDWIMRMAAAK